MNFCSRVIANFVFCVTKKLIPKGVVTCQHFRPPVSFTREYIRGCSDYVMCSRRVCVSFVVHVRRNVRQICWETTMKQWGKRKCESSPWVKGKKKPGAWESEQKFKWLIERWITITANLRLVFFLWAAFTPGWQGVKTNKIFSAWKLRFYFSMNNLSSNEFIGYIDLADFYEIRPKWLWDIGAQKCVGL